MSSKKKKKDSVSCPSNSTRHNTPEPIQINDYASQNYPFSEWNNNKQLKKKNCNTHNAMVE